VSCCRKSIFSTIQIILYCFIWMHVIWNWEKAMIPTAVALSHLVMSANPWS
jgi:hypothetical protein